MPNDAECLTQSLLRFTETPEGHCAMNKALACHAGGQGSNPDTTKVPILSGTPAMCTLSLTMPIITCSSVNTCHGR